MKKYKLSLFNSISETKEIIENDSPTIYSCGPTVYDHPHIGNWRSFIFSDLLRRSLIALEYRPKVIMNITDVDDKTISKSRGTLKSRDDLLKSLKNLTEKYTKIFIEEARELHIDLNSVQLLKATDHIEQIKELILNLQKAGIAYPAEDGIYFSIEEYNKKYNNSYGVFNKSYKHSVESRINNDEYDKESVSDFALWKREPSSNVGWEFNFLQDQYYGRPGWHIECSAMSNVSSNLPIDIHTGGIDLKFPHHENEIAQTKGATGHDLAKVFAHNEHILIEDKKMSKSLGNIMRLNDIEKLGYGPIVFRLSCALSHYRSQSNFSVEKLEEAQSLLNDIYMAADRQFQSFDNNDDKYEFNSCIDHIKAFISDDLNFPEVFFNSKYGIVQTIKFINGSNISSSRQMTDYFMFINNLLGLGIESRSDLSSEEKQLIADRNSARDSKDFKSSDLLRDQLKERNIIINDAEFGTVWAREYKFTRKKST